MWRMSNVQTLIFIAVVVVMIALAVWIGQPMIEGGDDARSGIHRPDCQKTLCRPSDRVIAP